LQASNSTHTGDTGTAGGNPQPNNVTFALARKSGLRGRSFNGRVYWPGISSGQISANNILSAVVAAAMVAALQTLDDGVTALDAIAVIVSWQHDHVTVTEGVVSEIVDWLFTDTTLDSRRRRLPGRGT
jgi:hypothetical protein